MDLTFPLLTDDPPRHTVLRALLAKAFTPAAVEAMRPDIDRLAGELADPIPKDREVDIVEAMTGPLPVAVICHMMGVPNERAMDFKRWSNAILGIHDGPIGGERNELMTELRAFFAKLAAERRAAPGDDLVSALTCAGDVSETLSDDQVVAFCVLLMVAGNETTTHLLANLLNRLARTPKAWQALRADQRLIEPAIEESLRLDAPTQFTPRLATEDVDLAGKTIKAGDRVMVYLASANRDPSRWQDAAAFDIERERERHISFGHGIHACIGASLARMEGKAALQALVARFASITPGAECGRRVTSGMLNGFRSMSVVFG
jgi:cytochrome P450